jgi:hypothetical protein
MKLSRNFEFKIFLLGNVGVNITSFSKEKKQSFHAGFFAFWILQLFFYWLYICLVVIVNAGCFLWITQFTRFFSATYGLYKSCITALKSQDSLWITFDEGDFSPVIPKPCTACPQAYAQQKRVSVAPHRFQEIQDGGNHRFAAAACQRDEGEFGRQAHAICNHQSVRMCFAQGDRFAHQRETHP